MKMRYILLVIAFLGIFQSQSYAGGGSEGGGFNAKEVIFGHIKDSYDWHFFDIDDHPVSIPLPVILYSEANGLDMFLSSKFEHGHASHNGYRLNAEHNIEREDGGKFYDFSMTKNVVSMLIGTTLLLLIFISVGNAAKRNGATKAPKGLQNAMEPLITFVRDEVAKPSLGHKYMKYMPLLLTVFFFIWINNLLGLIPSGANFTGNIAVTAALALISFLVMVFSGNKHFWGHLFNPPGVPFGVKLLLVPIEIISLFIKPIALMIRLFANILAGHIIILSVISMIFIFGGLSAVAGWGFSPISIAFTVFMFFLELLVAAIQAFIFTNLTAVFIGQAVEEGHDHDHHAEDYHPHNPHTGQEYNVSEETIVA